MFVSGELLCSVLLICLVRFGCSDLMCYMCIGRIDVSGLGGSVGGICRLMVLELVCGLNIIWVFDVVSCDVKLFGMIGSGGIMMMW